jgi:hypothetical protein
MPVTVQHTQSQVVANETRVRVSVQTVQTQINVNVGGGNGGGGGSVDLYDGTPAAVGNASAGSSDEAARGDHVHAHGNQLGGALHAAATTLANGFMTSAQVTKLNGIEDGADATVFSDDAPPAIASSSSAGDVAEAARGNHTHEHGSQAGGSLHAAATTLAAGFMTTAQVTKLDGIASGATANAPYTSTPAAVSTSGGAGASALYARGDHVHAHGNQTDENLHALASLTAKGFMAARHFRLLADIYDVVADGGADPTGVADSLAAFNLAMASTCRRINIPAGHYKMSGTWNITRPVEVVGAGQEYASGSVLITQTGFTCIHIQYIPAPSARNAYIHDIQVQNNVTTTTWSSGVSCVVGTVVKPSNAAGGYKGLVYYCTVAGTGGAVEPTWPTTEGGSVSVPGGATFVAKYIKGFHFSAPAMVERCLATGVNGDGFSVYASTGDGENANGCLLIQCVSSNNHGWGFYTQGADSNACTFINCSAGGNGFAIHTALRGMDAEIGVAFGGFCDNSFLMNRYFGCNAEGNHGYGFMVPYNESVGGQVNQSTFVGCYVESDQETAINQRASWYGGIAPDGVYGSGNIQSWERANSLYFSNDLLGDGSGASAYIRTGRLLSLVTLEMGWSDDSNRPLQFGYGNVNGAAVTGWCGFVYNGTVSPIAFSTQSASDGAGHSWLGQRTFLGPYKSHLVPQRLVAATTVSVAAGGSDALSAHVPARDQGTEATAFATLAGARGYCPKDLNGFALTVNDNRVSGSESLTMGGFVNGRVTINTPRLATATFRDMEVELVDAVITGLVTFINCKVIISGACTGSGRVRFEQCSYVDVDLTATSLANTAIYARECAYVRWALASSSATATPVEFVGCNYTEIAGTGYTGTNAGASFAIRLAAGGKHVITGITATAAADLDLDGSTVTFDALSVDNYKKNGTFVFWADNHWVDLDAPPYLEVTAFAGFGQAGATLVGMGNTIVTVCVNEGASIRLLAASEAPVVEGMQGTLLNTAANPAAVFPPIGKKIFLNGIDLGTNNYCYIVPGDKLFWELDSSFNYHVTRVTGDNARHISYDWQPNITLGYPHVYFDNQGSGVDVVVTLEPPANDSKITGTVIAAHYIRMNVPASSTLYINGLTTTGYIRSNTPGSSITLKAVGSDKYVAIAITGTWKVDE